MKGPACMHLDQYRPAPPTHQPSHVPALPQTPRPIGRYVLVGGAVLAAATWSIAVLTILVIALAIGAVAVAVLAATLRSLIGSQKR
jgi:hypothetical protein